MILLNQAGGGISTPSTPRRPLMSETIFPTMPAMSANNKT
jgi:hypothetical protein